MLLENCARNSQKLNLKAVEEAVETKQILSRT